MRIAGLHSTLAVALVLLAAACGTEEPGASGSKDEPTTTVVRAPGDPKLAGDAITAFGTDLFKAVAADAGTDENVIVSPTSVAVALAMLEPGTSGAATPELRKVLHIADPAAFHTSMGALEASLETRKARPSGDPEQKPGEVTMQVANAAYVQNGFDLKPEYVDAVTSHYGAAIKSINFTPSKPAADEVNKFISDATKERIKDLVADDTFNQDTVMALVNALYLKASWLETFDKSATKDDPFTRLNGSKVTVPLMHHSSDASNRSDGWVGAEKRYVGGLSAQFILPDEGNFDKVAADLSNVFADFEKNPASGAELVVPKFETRTEAKLKPALETMGMKAAFDPGALLGIAGDDRVAVEDVLHATFLAMDEEGTEAAAATVVLAHIDSAPVNPPKPVPVVLDRPFIFRIVDQETGATLFIGRVMDPTT